MSEASGQQQQSQSQQSSDGGAAGGEGQQQQQQPAAYYESFKDEALKTNPDIQKYKTPEDLARAYTNAAKLIGANPAHVLKLPDKLDDPEAMKAVWQKLGGPEKVDGYKVNLEGATDADKAAIGGYLEAMHKAGPFPPAVVEASVKWFRDAVAATETANLEEAKRLDEAGQAELKTEWGAAFDARSTEVGKLLADVGGPDLAKELDGSALGSNPKLAIFLGKLVDKMAEGGPRRDAQDADTGDRALTPAQATARARELEAHPAFRDPNHAQHKDVVNQRNNALRMAAPQQQPA